MSLPRYPEYKDSGAPWIGHIPAHWGVTPIKGLAWLKGGVGFPDSEQGLEGKELGFYKVAALGQTDGNTLLPAENTISRDTANRLGAFIFPQRTVVFAKVGAALLLGRIKELPESACLDNNMMGMVANQNTTDVSFLRYAMSLVRFDLLANPGAVPSVNAGQIGNFQLASPPIREQTTIATFLDRETRKIDALIAEQEKLLALLAEKRQATISHAVTKGLNPGVPMKDSGVAWLGEVPEHWETIRLGALFREVSEPGNEELPLLSVSIHDGVSDKELDEKEMDRKVTRSDDRSKYKAVSPGDLTYNMMRAWQGGFGSVLVEGMVSPAYVVARPTREFSTSLIEQQLRTPNAVTEMKRHSRGITDFRLRLYWEEFKTICVALPPKSEQDEILLFIESESFRMNALADEANHSIALLKERRSALIAAAVTGQIDVRKAIQC